MNTANFSPHYRLCNICRVPFVAEYDIMQACRECGGFEQIKARLRSKKCAHCGAVLYSKWYEGPARFAKRQFCSQRCCALHRRLRFIPRVRPCDTCQETYTQTSPTANWCETCIGKRRAAQKRAYKERRKICEI